MLSKPASVAKKPEGPKVEPAPIRERKVQRFIAFCPFCTGEEEFNGRSATLHPTKDAAIVESVRHIREAHADALFEQKTAIRRAQVQRTVIGEELIAE